MNPTPIAEPAQEAEASLIKPGDKWRQLPITFHDSPTFMDYLHGDVAYLHGEVKPEEALFACRYEYARESPDLWKLADERDKLRQLHPTATCTQATMAIFGQGPPEWATPEIPALAFLSCESFPAKDWNSLSEEERHEIMKLYRTRAVPPLDMAYVGLLRHKFKELAQAPLPPGEMVPQAPPLPIPPKPLKPAKPDVTPPTPAAMVCKGGPVYCCLFEVHFSESAKHLRQRFVAWLQRPDIDKLWREHGKQKSTKQSEPLRQRRAPRQSDAFHSFLFEVDLSAKKGDLVRGFKMWLSKRDIKKRLERYGKEKRGTTAEKDRLKDLAAWRLYRELGNDWNEANKFANDHRQHFEKWSSPYQPGDCRPFHNAKSEDLDLANQAALFSCDADYRHAKGRALKCLADWIYTGEFKKPKPREWLSELR